MVDGIISASRYASKPTYIYGLVDPRNHQLRYIGKTVMEPYRRVSVHAWRARKAPHKRHSMAWIANLEADGLAPEVFVIDTVAVGEDWVEAEQFWIGYFRMIGADLCNHTVGGEGQPGCKQSAETIAKRVKRGAEHHNFGKPMPEAAKVAVRAALAKKYADPEWKEWSLKRRFDAITPEGKHRSREALRKWANDPSNAAARSALRKESANRPETKQKTSASSKRSWAVNRERIIAAQNVGKSTDAWRKANSERVKADWAKPDNKMKTAMARRRKLSDDDIAEIRRLIAKGEQQRVIAFRFDVDVSLISHIKSRSQRFK